MQGIAAALAEAEVAAGDVDLVIHGTTLATNALIERKGARTALITTEGFRDIARDRLREPLRAVRHLHREARAAGPARPALHRARAHERQGRRAAPARRGGGRRRWCRSCEQRKSRASRSACCTAMPIPTHERRVREHPARSGCRTFRISLSSEVCPEVREYERFSTTCRQRLCPAADGAAISSGCRAELEATGFACPLYLMTVGRRADDPRDGDALSDPPGRIGAGRRRHPRGRHRRRIRHLTARAVLRHGRHHRQDLPDRRRQAAGLAQLRGRPRLPLHEGQRPAASASP